jgi:hypothetical protein
MWKTLQIKMRVWRHFAIWISVFIVLDDFEEDLTPEFLLSVSLQFSVQQRIQTHVLRIRSKASIKELASRSLKSSCSAGP